MRSHSTLSNQTQTPDGKQCWMGPWRKAAPVLRAFLNPFLFKWLVLVARLNRPTNQRQICTQQGTGKVSITASDGKLVSLVELPALWQRKGVLERGLVPQGAGSGQVEGFAFLEWWQEPPPQFRTGKAEGRQTYSQLGLEMLNAWTTWKNCSLYSRNKINYGVMRPQNDNSPSAKG